MIASHLRRSLTVSLGALALVGTLTVSNGTAQALPAGLPQASVTDSRAEVEALSSEQRQALQSDINTTLASTTGGTQISANEISWDDGQTILVLPLPGQEKAPASSPTAVPDAGNTSAEPDSVDWEHCPAGADDNRWYCFYQDSNFGGRRLQWNWAHCDAKLNLADYDFSRKASSWVNTTPNKDYWGMHITVYDNLVRQLWVENPWTKVSSLGAVTNDKATFVKACRQ